MSDQKDQTDPEDETRAAPTGSGDPNDDRAHLQHQPPAQVDEERATAAEEDEDPVAHDARAAQEGGA